jgi:hypothetical protein
VKLKTTIEKDIISSFEKDSKENKNNIHHMQLVYRSQDAHNLLKKHPPQIQTNETGKVWLEVEIIDLLDSENPGFITQTSVFDLKTKNKISEFGQTYYLHEFIKNKKAIMETTSGLTQKEEVTKSTQVPSKDRVIQKN